VHWRRGSPGHPSKVGWPDGHLSPKAVMTITDRHPVPVTRRPRPCGAHGPVPRPGMTHRQTPALTGQHCGPFCVRRRRATGHGRGRRDQARLRTSPVHAHGMLCGRLVRVSADSGGASVTSRRDARSPCSSIARCPCLPLVPKDPPVAAYTAGSCRGRYTPAGSRDGCTTPPDARPGPRPLGAASKGGQRQSR
jgi:hypothetical protein